MIDLFPTLTQLCGVATPAGLDGSSLAPLLKDPEQGAWQKTEAYTINAWRGEALRTGRYRVILWQDGELGTELYDLEQDPGEHRNLAAVPEHAELLERMTRQLREKRIATGTPPEGPKKCFLFEGPRSKK